MDYLDSFGDWLRQRREALRLTRPELADCAGCSVSALRKIEADERRPSRQLAELLAGCLHISPEEQPTFIDAARGARRVAQLGSPAPPATRLPPVPSPPSSGVPLSTPAAGPDWNLPFPMTPLVGRGAELASLEISQQASQDAFELVLYILQHPSSSQEMKNLAIQLRAELESRLTVEEIEAARERVESMDLDEVVHQFLAGA